MSNRRQFFLIYLFQIIPLLFYPPELLKSGIVIIGILVLVYALLGYGIWRGRNWALSLSITLQGFNIVIRLLMLFPNALMRLPEGGFVFDLPYLALSAVSIGLSLFFLLRLDRPDIRATIVA
jgi:hypothetical protein